LKNEARPDRRKGTIQSRRFCCSGLSRNPHLRAFALCQNKAVRSRHPR
jgi:hypothetical protein